MRVPDNTAFETPVKIETETGSEAARTNSENMSKTDTEIGEGIGKPPSLRKGSFDTCVESWEGIADTEKTAERTVSSVGGVLYKVVNLNWYSLAVSTTMRSANSATPFSGATLRFPSRKEAAGPRALVTTIGLV